MAERFDPSISDKLLREIRISKVFHLRSGTTYCRSAGDDAFELADYGVSLQGLLVAFGYGLGKIHMHVLCIIYCASYRIGSAICRFTNVKMLKFA